MKYREYQSPASLAEAQNLLRSAGGDGLIIAGATSHPFLGGKTPKVAVDLHRAGLVGICPDGHRFVIGSMTSVAALEDFHGRGWVLDRVAARFVNRQIRNQSTLGGNVARVYPWADLPVALLALDAELTIRGEADRTLTAADFFRSQPAKLFAPGDILISIRVPALAAGQGFGYEKLTRVKADFSQMTVAVRVTVADGTLADVRVAVGAGLPMPTRLTDLESALDGSPADPAKVREVAAEPLGDRKVRTIAGMPPAYGYQLARVAVGDALEAAIHEARGGVA